MNITTAWLKEKGFEHNQFHYKLVYKDVNRTFVFETIESNGRVLSMLLNREDTCIRDTDNFELLYKCLTQKSL